MDLSLYVSYIRVRGADSSFYEVILGIIIGALLGYSARKIMKFAERKKLIDRQSYVAQYVSLAILSIGMSPRRRFERANVRYLYPTWK
jgi:NhaP-type Na+/H+ or K+/H+ antiporter